MQKSFTKTQKLTFSAMYIAMYIVIMALTQSFAFGQYQIRIATTLYALAYFNPFLIIPAGLANLMSNLFFGGLGYHRHAWWNPRRYHHGFARLRCPQIQPAEVVSDPTDHLHPWNRCADLPVATVGHPVPAACRQPLHRPIGTGFRRLLFGAGTGKTILQKCTSEILSARRKNNDSRQK